MLTGYYLMPISNPYMVSPSNKSDHCFFSPYWYFIFLLLLISTFVILLSRLLYFTLKSLKKSFSLHSIFVTRHLSMKCWGLAFRFFHRCYKSLNRHDPSLDLVYHHSNYFSVFIVFRISRSSNLFLWRTPCIISSQRFRIHKLGDLHFGWDLFIFLLWSSIARQILFHFYAINCSPALVYI